MKLAVDLAGARLLGHIKTRLAQDFISMQNEELAAQRQEIESLRWRLS